MDLCETEGCAIRRCAASISETEGVKVLYRNVWASSVPDSEDNVVDIVAAGRSRWKFENENNNTLKTQDYQRAPLASGSGEFGIAGHYGMCKRAAAK